MRVNLNCPGMAVKGKVKKHFLTIKSRTVQTDCFFAAFFRDLLFQPSFLQIGQGGSFQLIHELQFLLFG